MFGFSQASLDFLQAVLDFRKQVWNLQLGQNRDLQITDTTEKNPILIWKTQTYFFFVDCPKLLFRFTNLQLQGKATFSNACIWRFKCDGGLQEKCIIPYNERISIIVCACLD